MKTMEEIGAHLRELRKAAGLSLPQAAARAGMATVVLGSYERADRRPGVDQLAKVYAAYGFELRPVPIGTPGEADAGRVWTPDEIAATLASIARSVTAAGGAA